jgi:hypothetical protein
LLAAQAEKERLATAAKERAPAKTIHVAIFCLEVITLPLLGVSAWLFFAAPGRTVTRDIELYVCGTLLVLVMFIQAVSYGIYKGWAWARLAGIALLAMSVLSICLPVAVLGLMMLANGQAWDAYAGRRVTTEA